MKHTLFTIWLDWHLLNMERCALRGLLFLLLEACNEGFAGPAVTGISQVVGELEF